jgi:hypothetical protein
MILNKRVFVAVFNESHSKLCEVARHEPKQSKVFWKTKNKVNANTDISDNVASIQNAKIDFCVRRGFLSFEWAGKCFGLKWVCCPRMISSF